MSDLSPTGSHKISLLRARLDGFAAWHAARRVVDSPGGVRELRGALPELTQASYQGDYPAFRKADLHLHETIIHVADVPFLHNCWLVVWEGMESLRESSFEGWWPDLRVLSREHEYLVETICLGDPTAAEDAARDHVEAVWYRYNEVRRETEKSDPVQSAVAYLTFHMSAPVQLTEVARAVFTSPGNLSRLFRGRYGMGFQAYLQKLRLQKAGELLATTGLPVSRVAHRVGYRDVSRFGQHFKRFYGLTPTRYREQLARWRQQPLG